MDHSQYAELFRIEAREHLAALDAALIALEQEDGAQSPDVHVATLFRGMHTIKGTAAAMGYGSVERLAHALESFLDGVRSGSQRLTAETIALLLDGTDVLGQAVTDAVEGRGDEERTATRALLERLASDAPAGDRAVSADGMQLGSAVYDDAVGGAIGAADAGEDAAAIAAQDARVVDVRLTADCPLKGVRAMLVLARLAAMGDVLKVQPPQERWQDDAFEGAFTVTLATTADDAELDAAAHAAGDIARVVVRREVPVAPAAAPPSEALRHVRIDLRRLDTLLDLIGELVITRDRLLRVAESSVEQGADRTLTRVAHDTARLVTALQDEVLQARMVPVGQVFDRFPRLVRDVARDLGKDVQFVMEGREITLDRSLLDAIGDPIIHLLRNALDHGLEDAETRRAGGKSPTSRLVLRAARDRASVVIQVEDDGRGIDREAVLRRAVQRGLLTAADGPLDDDRLLQTLAHSGFSTAQAVTSLSGRGVGVDVVTTRVRALGGFLSLETIEGVGTVFTMRLPTTLAITRAVLVSVHGETYALPAAHVVEAVEYDAAMRVERDGHEGLTLRDELLPVVRLRERFACPPGDGEGHVAIVEVAGRRSALLVDAILAQQDVVVKPFQAIRGGAPWFSGATVLGDGTPSLIVDLGSLT